MKSRTEALIKQLVLLTVGSIIYAIGIGCFLDPNNIAPGGLAGIAMLLCEFIPIDSGLMTFLLNFPLLVVSYIRFKEVFLISTLYSTALSSAVIDLLAAYVPSAVPISENLMLCSIIGSAIMSAGMGIVYLGGGSTGGMDIIIHFLRQSYPHLKTGTMSIVSDLVVAILSALVYRDVEFGLYAIITLFVCGYVVDKVLYGVDESKLLFIISDKTRIISTRIMEELEIGVTWLDGTGAYTGSKKDVIFTVFKKSSYKNVKDIVRQEDPSAFMIVSSASEIYGEGFKDHLSDEF